MPQRHGAGKMNLAAAAAVCLALAVSVQTKIEGLRAPLREKAILPTQLPLAAAASAALGGFRGVAVDFLWIQADTMINERQFYQLRTCYEVIAMLQPNFPTVWTYNAWNMAFNISAEWPQPDDKWLWVKEGIKFAKQGLLSNPESEDLNFYVGFLYYVKVGQDKTGYFPRKLQEEENTEPFYEAHRYFQKAADIAFSKGDLDVRTASASMRALFLHGKAVLAQTGNVPAAMESFNKADEGARALAVQFPGDAAVAILVEEIRQEKAKFGR